jgi:hypothetical protein
VNSLQISSGVTWSYAETGPACECSGTFQHWLYWLMIIFKLSIDRSCLAMPDESSLLVKLLPHITLYQQHRFHGIPFRSGDEDNLALQYSALPSGRGQIRCSAYGTLS